MNQEEHSGWVTLLVGSFNNETLTITTKDTTTKDDYRTDGSAYARLAADAIRITSIADN